MVISKSLPEITEVNLNLDLDWLTPKMLLDTTSSTSQGKGMVMTQGGEKTIISNKPKQKQNDKEKTKKDKKQIYPKQL